MSDPVDSDDKPKLTPEEALAIASGEKWQNVVIIGWHEDGEFRHLNSDASLLEVNWLLDRLKLKVHADSD